MSHIERNMSYLNRYKVIYRQYPISDEPSLEHRHYNFYKEGTFECYELFRSRAKITTFKSLKWHLLVLWYLNPEWHIDKFKIIALFIANKSNGFVTFNISEKFLTNMVHDISNIDLSNPPRNKARKVIFKDGTGLSTSEKLSIVGSLIGRDKKVTTDDIYQCMLDINDGNQKITIDKLAGVLKCSNRTIYRNLPHELKKEKDLLNKQITN